MKNLLSLGIILIFLGIFLVFVSSIITEKQDIKTAGGLFIGPFPLFGFASNQKMLYLLFVMGILIFIIFIILRKWI